MLISYHNLLTNSAVCLSVRRRFWITPAMPSLKSLTTDGALLHDGSPPTHSWQHSYSLWLAESGWQLFTLIGWVELTVEAETASTRDAASDNGIEPTDSQSVSSYLMTSGEVSAEDLDNQRTENRYLRPKQACKLSSLSLSVSLSLFLYLDKGNVESEIVILILYGTVYWMLLSWPY